MRKFALALICLVSAVSLTTAEDLPPPPFVAPPDDTAIAAPPPPAINIDEITPDATAAPTKEPSPSLENPTMLPTEGVRMGKEAPPAPVLILGDEATGTPTLTPAPGNARAEAPAAPVISMPVESPVTVTAVATPASGYEQIGGSKAEPPAWFFTPEAVTSTSEAPAAPPAPVVVIAADTPMPEPTAVMAAPTPQPVEAPPAPVIAVEAPAAPVITIDAPVVEATAVATEPAPLTVNLEKPKPGADLLSDTVEAEMKKAPRKNPEESFAVALLLGRGRELEAKGRFYEAWRTYRDIVKDHPGDLRGWGAMNSFYALRLTERARALEKQKRYYEAANLYRDIVTRDASVASAWFGLGNIFYKYHKKEQAIYCFDRVMKLKPKMKVFKKWLNEYKGQ